MRKHARTLGTLRPLHESTMKELCKSYPVDSSFHKEVDNVVDRPENTSGGSQHFGSLGIIGHIDLLSPGGEEVRKEPTRCGPSSLECPARWALIVPPSGTAPTTVVLVPRGHPAFRSPRSWKYGSASRHRVYARQSSNSLKGNQNSKCKIFPVKQE